MEKFEIKHVQLRHFDELRSLLKEGSNLGLVLSDVINKLDSVVKSVSDDIIIIVLLGSFSDGKTTAIAGMLGRLDDSMKIDLDESSDDLVVYRPIDLKDGFEIVDTPGLWGTKEKEIDTKTVKFSEITEKYISEAHIVIYVCDALNPLKESHSHIMYQVLRTYNKLDSTIFVINKMDNAGYDLTDADEFNQGVSIKKQTLIKRLKDTIHLTQEEAEKLNIVCIAADPKSKGLEYWFTKMDDYLKRSRIGELRIVLNKVVSNSDESLLKNSMLNASIKDMLLSTIQVIQISEEPTNRALEAMEGSCNDLRLDLDSLKNDLIQSQQRMASKLDSLQESVLADIDGASAETINAVIESEIGIEEKDITFYKLIRNINLILNECAEQNNSSVNIHSINFEKEFEKQDGLIHNALQQGAGWLGKIAISGEQVKKMRNIFAPAHKFKPWGAIKMGEKWTKILNKAGVAIAVLIEAWDIWKAIKNKKKLAELKDELKKAINGYFSEVSKFFSDNDTYYQNFAPGYLDLQQQLRQREEDINVIRNRMISLGSFKSKLSSWCKDNIEDVDFEELL